MANFSPVRQAEISARFLEQIFENNVSKMKYAI